MLSQRFKFILSISAVLVIMAAAAVLIMQSGAQSTQNVTQNTLKEIQNTQNDTTAPTQELVQQEVDPVSAPVAELDEQSGAQNTLKEIQNTQNDIAAPIVAPIQELEPASNEAPIQATEPAVDPVIVMLTGPGVSKRCTVAYTEAVTVHQIMKQAGQQCHFSYRGKNYPALGWFVDEIAQLKSNVKGGNYWIYYVNNTKAKVGVSAYSLKPGDTITWKYEQEY